MVLVILTNTMYWVQLKLIFYITYGEEEIFKDKSVDEWCLENNIASSTIYTSMREERVLKRGRFKGYRFFRFGSTDK